MGIFLNKAIAVVLATLIGICIFTFVALIIILNKYDENWFLVLIFAEFVGLYHLSGYIYNGLNYSSGEEVN
jgi:uncharacterized membrane protein YccC